MKIQSKLTAVVSMAALITGPLGLAEDATPFTPERVVCEAAPEIAVCPEPCIFPEAPEICILPAPTEPPTEEPISDDIHIDPVVEITPDMDFTEGSDGQVGEDEVIDTSEPGEMPSDTDLTEGSDGNSVENEVVDSSDPSTDNEVSKPLEDDPVLNDWEKGVPIEWLKRGGSKGDPPVMYNMAGNLAPLMYKGEAPNAIIRVLGQDEKPAAIVTKANAATPQITSHKNAPVALIKKGRVFLR